MSLFGTAIGAGVLFLPINAGAGGLFSLLLITILALPVMYYSHRAMAKMIIASDSADEGVTGTIREYFGKKASIIFNIVYFFSIYTIVLMYSVALTNTASSFMVNQLGMQEPPRAILSLVLVLGLIAILKFWTRYYCKGNEYACISIYRFSAIYRGIFDSTMEYVNA